MPVDVATRPTVVAIVTASPRTAARPRHTSGTRPATDTRPRLRPRSDPGAAVARHSSRNRPGRTTRTACHAPRATRTSRRLVVAHAGERIDGNLARAVRVVVLQGIENAAQRPGRIAYEVGQRIASLFVPIHY